MALKLITPPASLPVTVAEAKAHINLGHSEDDAMVEGFIAAAVSIAQNLTGRQLVEAEYELVLDAFPCAIIELPRPDLLAVSSVKYIDPDGVEQTLAATEYTVDADSLVGRVYPAYGKSWPATRAVPSAVRVRYTCGWPMSEATSPPAWTGPDAIKTWLKVRVATLYAQREALVQGQTVNELPRSHVDGLLDPYVIPVVV